MIHIPYEIRDLRRYNAKAVEIAQLLGSDEAEDFLAVDAWLRNYRPSGAAPIEQIAELFDLQVGLATNGHRRETSSP